VVGLEYKDLESNLCYGLMEEEEQIVASSGIVLVSLHVFTYFVNGPFLFRVLIQPRFFFGLLGPMWELRA
jgi:hypothetical protein